MNVCLDETAPDAPARLRQNGRAAIDEAVDLFRRYDGAANGRIGIAFAPRWAISCARPTLEAIAHTSAGLNALVHTHACEQQDELAMVRDATGHSSVQYFGVVGMMSPRLNVAHCVWTDDSDHALMARHDVKVTHCPGSNLKLGSGIAPVTEMRTRGLNVSLGADAAACNNHLDMFNEMRLSAGLQSIRHSPGTLSARDVLWMATRGGAAALGLSDQIGSIEVGKKADLILLDGLSPHVAPSPDPFSAVVYAGGADDVRLTMVDGEILVREGIAVHLDAAEISADARSAAAELARRAL